MTNTPFVVPAPDDAAETAPASGAGPNARFLTALTVGWVLSYALVLTVLAAVEPSVGMSTIGRDLVLLSGWPCIAVLLIAAVVTALQSTLMPAARRNGMIARSLTMIAAILAAALTFASALLLLDLVAAVLWGLGLVFDPSGTLVRLGAVAAAGLIALHTRRFWVQTRAADCRPHRTAMRDVPWWARAAGYLAAIGCLVRLGAQAVVGFDMIPFAAGPAILVFEGGFLLAGLLLPLALVHRWGRIWPSWVPRLAGRRVPRWLLIISGGVLGVGLTAYFGMGFGQMIADRIQGRVPFPSTTNASALPEAFFWVSIPAYLLWGAGLLVATIAYHRLTRPTIVRRSGRSESS